MICIKIRKNSSFPNRKPNFSYICSIIWVYPRPVPPFKGYPKGGGLKGGDDMAAATQTRADAAIDPNPRTSPRRDDMAAN